MRADDPKLAEATVLANRCEAKYNDGCSTETAAGAKEGIELLDLSFGDTSKINSFRSALPLFSGIAFEFLRQLGHRLRLGLWAERIVVRLRGADKYYTESARLTFMVFKNNMLY